MWIAVGMDENSFTRQQFRKVRQAKYVMMIKNGNVDTKLSTNKIVYQHLRIIKLTETFESNII